MAFWKVGKVGREREKKKSKKKMKDLLLTVVLGGGLFGMGL